MSVMKKLDSLLSENTIVKINSCNNIIMFSDETAVLEKCKSEMESGNFVPIIISIDYIDMFMTGEMSNEYYIRKDDDGFIHLTLYAKTKKKILLEVLKNAYIWAIENEKIIRDLYSDNGNIVIIMKRSNFVSTEEMMEVIYSLLNSNMNTYTNCILSIWIYCDHFLFSHKKEHADGYIPNCYQLSMDVEVKKKKKKKHDDRCDED